MKNFLRVMTVWAALGLLPATVWAADDVSVSASVDKETVGVGERFVLSLTITGARNASEPELPPLDGFQVLSSGTTTQFQFINGQMYSSRSYTYVLAPQRVGKFTIPAARWDYDGRVYTTQPLSVEVVQGRTQPQQQQGTVLPGLPVYDEDEQAEKAAAQSRQRLDLGDRLFVQVKTDKEEVYLNEQVILIFRLYRRNLGLDDLQYTPPATTGFIEESLGKQKETRELINGEMYDVIELKTALFPASTGDLTISPASLKCNVLVRAQRRSQQEGMFGGIFEDSFFGNPYFDRFAKYPVELQSKPVTVRVKPLPAQQKPKNFQGAVGDFQMEAWIRPTTTKVGEPVNLTMKIVGTGNISSLVAPSVLDLEHFKTYDSESKVNLQERIDAIGGEKIFEKVLIPQKGGKLKIPAVQFSFFNPRSGTYETVSEGPFWVDVEDSGEGKASMIVTGAGASAAKEDVQIVKRDILFIKEHAGRMHQPSAEIWRKSWFWWAQAMPLLLLLGTVLLQRRRERLSGDERYTRQRRAYSRARHGLQEAQKLMDAGDARVFHQALHGALGDYLADRWHLPSGEITPRDVREVLMPKGLDAALAEKIIAALDRMDQGRFARVAASREDMRALHAQIGELLKALERGRS